MKRLILILFLFFLVPTLSAAPDSCVIDSSCPSGFSEAARVTTQGHLAPSEYGAGNRLCCSENWAYDEAELGEISFYITRSGEHNGVNQGHIYPPGSQYWEYGDEFRLAGNLQQCRVTSGSCLSAAYEACVLKMGTEDGGHIGSCANEDLDYTLCCEVREVCTNNDDNSGDGFVGCASPFCHASDFNNDQPQECTGNQQTSQFCIENPEECKDQSGDIYYCNYGLEENQSSGFCCPQGTYASDDGLGSISCEEFTQCGISSFEFCQYDFETQTEDWFDSQYAGDTNDWCVSSHPDYFTEYIATSEDPNRVSGACCLVERYAGRDYYEIPDNVRVYG